MQFFKQPIAMRACLTAILALSASLSCPGANADDAERITATSSFLVSDTSSEALRVTAFWDDGRGTPTVYFVQVCDKETRLKCHDLAPDRAFLLDSELNSVLADSAHSRLLAFLAHLVHKTTKAELADRDLKSVAAVGSRRQTAGSTGTRTYPTLKSALVVKAPSWAVENDAGDVKVVSLPTVEAALKPAIARSSLGQFGAY